jgi:hypothetical protein
VCHDVMFWNGENQLLYQSVPFFNGDNVPNSNTQVQREKSD